MTEIIEESRKIRIISSRSAMIFRISRHRRNAIGLLVAAACLLESCSGGASISSPPPFSRTTEYTTGLPVGDPLHAIVAGPGGNIWFTDDLGYAGRITPGGQLNEIQAFPVVQPVNGNFNVFVNDIAVADGNLWYTVTYPNQSAIGEMTPTGAYTIYLLSQVPNGICRGPDGNVWFTETSSHKIGRITPGGSLAFLDTGHDTGPASITSGPDGHLWFTEAIRHNIGRIDPANGGVILFPVAPSPHGGLLAGMGDLAFGPDGQIWFPDSTNDTIRRMTTAGQFSEFYSGISPSAGLGAITLGPDGNMWFTESQLNRIGRITPSGSVTEFGVGGSPLDIVAGADGDIWYTQVNPTAIGRFRLH
jgi:virginiamycin B lyase